MTTTDRTADVTALRAAAAQAALAVALAERGLGREAATRAASGAGATDRLTFAEDGTARFDLNAMADAILANRPLPESGRAGTATIYDAIREDARARATAVLTSRGTSARERLGIARAG
jgi:hypothetical protein